MGLYNNSHRFPRDVVEASYADYKTGEAMRMDIYSNDNRYYDIIREVCTDDRPDMYNDISRLSCSRVWREDLPEMTLEKYYRFRSMDPEYKQFFKMGDI